MDETEGVMRTMKVWCIPVNFPKPEEQKEQAEAAVRFLKTLKGLKGVCPHESGNVLLCFPEKGDARAAKWKLEEFTEIRLPMIEGTLTDDGKTLNCHRVLKGE